MSDLSSHEQPCHVVGERHSHGMSSFPWVSWTVMSRSRLLLEFDYSNSREPLIAPVKTHFVGDGNLGTTILVTLGGTSSIRFRCGTAVTSE